MIITPAGFTLSPNPLWETSTCVVGLSHRTITGVPNTHINEIAARARQLASWALGVFRDRSAAVMLTIWKYIRNLSLS